MTDAPAPTPNDVDVVIHPEGSPPDLIIRAMGTKAAGERNNLLGEALQVLADLEAGVGDASALTPEALEVADNPDAKLTAALARAQGAFPTIKKTQEGRVVKAGVLQYTYSYADIADVLAAVRPALAANGLIVTQRTHYANPGQLILTTELRHVAGGILDSVIELAQDPGNHQAFGGALTYLRRYELTTLLGVAAEEDRDGADVDPVRTATRAGVEPAAAREVVVPEWAQPATVDAVAKVTAGLADLFADDESAAGFLDAVASYAGGSVPAVVSRALIGVATRLNVNIDDAVIARADRLKAKAAQDAAEQPDTPAPEPGIDAVAEEVAERLGEAQQEDGHEPEPEEERKALPPPPDGYDHWPTAKTFLADREREAQALEPPEPFGLKAAEDALRSAGCPCSDPMGIRGPERTADECPFADHGIPF